MLVFDALTEVLRTMHLQSAIFCRSEFRSPWGVKVGEEYGYRTKFHVMVSGQCWLQVQGLNAPVHLSEGDLVLLPHGATLSISDTLTSPVIPLEELHPPRAIDGFKTLQYGEGAEPSTVAVSGGMKFCDSATNPLLAALPPLIHIKGEEGRLMPWLRTTLQSLEYETASDLPGRQTVLTRLAEILFVQAVRSYLAQLPENQGGWLRALTEPGISLALGSIHCHPEQNWTVASLARQASMSRSGFAARFTQLVGTPPLKYLTNWRMHKAAELLHDENWTVKEIAVRVGYDSEVAFNQAFKRWSGFPPGVYRRRYLVEG